MAEIELRDYTLGDETQIVQILAKSFFPYGWQNEDYWRWRYLYRPGFNPQDVVIAHVDGKMVGCLHGTILPLRLEAGLEVPMSFDGNFAVLAEHRGTGITIQVHDLTDRRLLERGVFLRGGFATRKINDRFYNKRFGHVFVPAVTARFRKVIGLSLLQRKVETLGVKLLSRSWLRRALKKQLLVVDLQIDSFPPSHIEFTEGAFQLRDGVAQQPDLRIHVPYNLLVALVKGPVPLVKSAFLNLLRGRLRIRGLLRKGPKLLALFWSGITRR